MKNVVQTCDMALTSRLFLHCINLPKSVTAPRVWSALYETGMQHQVCSKPMRESALKVENEEYTPREKKSFCHMWGHRISNFMGYTRVYWSIFRRISVLCMEKRWVETVVCFVVPEKVTQKALGWQKKEWNWWLWPSCTISYTEIASTMENTSQSSCFNFS